MDVAYDSGSVIGLVTDVKSVSTPRGVHAGSSLNHVLNKYGQNYMLSSYENLDLYEYTLQNENGKPYILRLLPLHLKGVYKDGNNEKVFRYLNSFDSSDKTYILKAQQFDSEYEKILIPIGLFEFGDLLCYERDTNKITIYNHEQDKYEIIADNFNEFKNKLS